MLCGRAGEIVTGPEIFREPRVDSKQCVDAFGSTRGADLEGTLSTETTLSTERFTSGALPRSFVLPIQALFSRTAVLLGLVCLCSAAGLLTIFSSVRALLDIWRTDDLKSVGIVVPFLSFALILRAWRRLGWVAEGSWWGFVLLTACALLVFLRDQTLFIVTVNKTWLLQIPPLPVVALLYAAGLVLLFGGVRLLRAAVFPVLLMLAVVPVPQTFSRSVDLPLQHASASVARAFAHALGQQLTEDRLRLMFTPEFGMFIAPGCNGIRGAVTLGLAALVVSHLYRFRGYLAVPVIAGAVLLGYLFNFARLCVLVLYYELALPYPWLQQRAKTADYFLGGCLFVGALLLFFAVANRLRRNDPGPAGCSGSSFGEPLRAPVSRSPMSSFPVSRYPLSRATLSRAVALLALSALFGGDAFHTVRAEAAARAAVAPLPSSLPERIGDWTRTRTWTDTMTEGTVVYLWAEYIKSPRFDAAGLVSRLTPNGESQPPPAAAARVALGVSPVLGVHDAEVCHIARGEDPTWHGQLQLVSAGGEVALSAATYNNGRVQKLEASTVCDNGSCRQFSQTGEHVTLVYGRPHRNLPGTGDLQRPVPLLLKVDSSDTLSAANVAAPRLAAQLADFVRDANLPAIAAPFTRR